MSPAIQHIIVLFTGYIFFFVAEKASAKINSHKLAAILFRKGNMGIWQLKTIYGLLLLGSCVVYYQITSPVDLLSFSFLYQEDNDILILVIMMTFTVAGFYHALAGFSPGGPLQPVLITRSLFSYLALQIPFLAVYELFFRGALFFEVAETSGPGIAFIVNMILYVLMNARNNKKEIVESLFVSAVLCMVCQQSGSAMPAVIIRIAIAVIYDFRVFHFLKTLLNHN